MHEKLENFVAASRDCNAALSLDGRSSSAYACRVNAFASLGDHDSAAMDSMAGTVCLFCI